LIDGEEAREEGETQIQIFALDEGGNKGQPKNILTRKRKT